MKKLYVLLSLLTLFFSAQVAAQGLNREDTQRKDGSEYYNPSHVNLPYTEASVTDLDLTPSLNSYEGGFDLNVVVEEGTGAWCAYCPKGIVMCEYIRQKYSDRIFPIAIHNDDAMEIPEYKRYFIDFANWFPSAFANRKEEIEVSNSAIDLLYDKIKDQKTYARVGVTAKLNGKTLSINSEAEFATDSDVEHRLAFVIVEDGVGPYYQKNGYGAGSGLGMWDSAGDKVSILFNDVARHIKTFKGIEGSLPKAVAAKSKYSYSTTMELTNVTSTTFRVIALLINAASGEIVNSSQYTVIPEGTFYLDKSVLNITIGEKVKLTAKVAGSDKDNPIKWSSSDEKIATVDEDGNVTGCGEGRAEITATCDKGSAKCEVNVALLGSVFEYEGIMYQVNGDNSCMLMRPDDGKHYEMEELTIPSQIEKYGKSFVVNELEFGAFEESPNLRKIDLPNTISVLPGDIFTNCNKLTEISIPSSVGIIDGFAFFGCNALSQVGLNEGLRVIWNYSFWSCDNLKDIVLPASLEKMGKEVFAHSEIERIQSKALTPPVVHGDFFIKEEEPEKYKNCVLAVPEESISAYKEAEYWKNFEIIVPDDVILNKYRLLMNLNDSEHLEVVNSDGQPVIWSSDNTDIVSIDADGNVLAKSFGETTVRAECKGKYGECKVKVSMEGLVDKVDGLWYSITGPQTCKVIKPNGQDRYTFETLTIPETVKLLGNQYTVTAIGEDAFRSCYSLKEIHFPSTLLEIENEAFENCLLLSEVNLPGKLITIGKQAFYYCGLTSVTIPNSVTTIGIAAFGYCRALTSVTLPNTITQIRMRAFYKCTALTEVVIPNSVTKIEEYAFEGCAALKSVSIPNSVTLIQYWAFDGCESLEEIVIPASVSELGQSAFEGTSLKKLKMLSSRPPLVRADLFESDGQQYQTCELIVPNQSIDLYKSHSIFGKFANIHGDESGLENIAEDGCLSCDIYSPSGILVAKDVSPENLKEIVAPGIYLLRFSNGKVRKVVINK